MMTNNYNYHSHKQYFLALSFSFEENTIISSLHFTTILESVNYKSSQPTAASWEARKHMIKL